MLKLYWAPKTRAARLVWMLEEMGVPYDLVPIDIGDEKAKADPVFRAASPMGKVPAIDHNGVLMWDSAAICAYLADAFPDSGLAPPVGSPLRARYYQWMVFTPGVIEPAMMEKARGLEPKPSHSGWGDFASMIEVFEKGLAEGPWMLGSQFSAADVMMGSSALFLRLFGMMPDSKILNDYADRCAARPAYRRAQEIERERG